VKPDELISPDYVREIHAELISLYGGKVGERTPNCIDGIVGNAYQGACYDSPDGEPDPLTVAANLLFYFARNQCLIDGNKRVAWATCVHQLSTFGLDVSASVEEAAEFTDLVGRGDRPRETVRTWLATRLVGLASPTAP
jgi:death-on-curing protein